MSQDPWGWYGRMIESDRNMQQQGMQNLMSGLNSAVGSVAGAYTDKAKSNQALKGMDQTMGAMADIGVLPEGFLNKYNQLDDETRPFIFQALASPMFQAYQKKQGYEAYATAMKDLYGSRGGGAPSPSFFEY